MSARKRKKQTSTRRRTKRKSLVLTLLGILGLAGCAPADNAASRTSATNTSATGTTTTFPTNNAPVNAQVSSLPEQHWNQLKGNYGGTIFKAVLFENPYSQAYTFTLGDTTVSGMKFGHILLQSTGTDIGNLNIEAFFAVAGSAVNGNVTVYTFVSNILQVADLSTSKFSIQLQLAVSTDGSGAHFNPTQSSILIKGCDASWSCPYSWNSGNADADFWLGDDFSRR